jgi:hypothetical protein
MRLNKKEVSSEEESQFVAGDEGDGTAVKLAGALGSPVQVALNSSLCRKN